MTKKKHVRTLLVSSHEADFIQDKAWNPEKEMLLNSKKFISAEHMTIMQFTMVTSNKITSLFTSVCDKEKIPGVF